MKAFTRAILENQMFLYAKLRSGVVRYSLR